MSMYIYRHTGFQYKQTGGVSVVQRLGYDQHDTEIRVPFKAEEEFSLFSKVFRQLWTPHTLTCYGYRVILLWW